MIYLVVLKPLAKHPRIYILPMNVPNLSIERILRLQSYLFGSGRRTLSMSERYVGPVTGQLRSPVPLSLQYPALAIVGGPSHRLRRKYPSA